MKCIFLLSGDYIGLGKEEALTLFDIKKSKSSDRILIAELKNENRIKFSKRAKRLALTKSVYKFLFECKIDDLKKAMEKFGWNSVYKESFSLRVHHFDDEMGGRGLRTVEMSEREQRVSSRISLKASETRAQNIASETSGIKRIRKIKSNYNKNNHDNKFSEKELAGYIWRSVDGPKVDLNNAKTQINLFFVKDKAYCGLLVYTNNEDFESRKSHLRPFPHPSSLHPKVARALVNMTGADESETLLDPFCGTGGFLIEAGLMGIRSIGYDISKMMAEGCAKNLGNYGINNCKIEIKNAIDMAGKFDRVATDLPYGLNSNALSEYHEGNWKKGRINKKIRTENFTKDLGEFYLQFLKSLRKNLKKGGKAVIVFPNYVNYKKIARGSGFRIEFEYSNYVHRSLTRKIVRVS